MTLHIEEHRWVCDRKTGRRISHPTLAISLPCVVGETPPMGKGGTRFYVVCIEGREVVLDSVSKDPRQVRRMTLTPEQGVTYAPLSFGAGYAYHITLEETT